jgi:iron complex outermembrane receptor protein
MWQLTIAQNAACTISVKGKVMDMNSIDALEDVSIAVLETQRGVLTDAFGKFQLNGLCKGKITLSVSHIGCQTQILNFDLLRDTTIKIKLDHTEVELNEVQVTEAKKRATLHNRLAHWKQKSWNNCGGFLWANPFLKSAE